MSAYWIAHVTIHDMEKYKQYMSIAPLAFAKYGAKFLVRGGKSTCLEGSEYERHIIIEFSDLASAQACYFSEEYSKARAARENCADVMISIVESIEGTPPNNNDTGVSAEYTPPLSSR
ncbi:MAG: DUF1330 domain-containing protein [Acinetobacter towneri]|jgi:uncharacterized protein (DUF1330 family)|uniref:DUF1330 domain-containing protein n=1 Tax=Acinetobacter TaxID=469 RepID=UPI0015B6FC7E|nr:MULTISPECIES: DUF1330 domain-containing protein [Acinetobacter]MBT0888585.1 DUF1330 domain-containing protein [Acinetobacter towneri]MDV2484484.1 DUF1330 domain-containing protein [Acinetobacter towneri]NWJ93989.1 DUF1330 domain-containing protein [Acinetobacter sp. Swhac1]UIZ58850.1 DUF1330 domain-containing protein [Acinetobacter sp. SCLZS86]